MPRDWIYYLVYSLWYPALLGTFIVSGLSGNHDTRYSWLWIPFLLIYFSIQHAEGMVDQEGFSGWHGSADVAEMVFMTIAFGQLYANGSLLFCSFMRGIEFPLAVTLALLVPPTYRVVYDACSGWEKLCKPNNRGFHRSLTGLSLVSALMTGLWYFCLVDQFIALTVFGLALLIYVFGFVLLNGKIFAENSQFRRPKSQFPQPKR